MRRRKQARTGHTCGRLGAVVLVALATTVALPAGAQTQRVQPTPSTLSLMEGQSQLVQFTLDEPIIAPGPDPAFVTLDLTADDPARVQLSAASLTWPADEWSQSRQVTITAIPDGVHNTSDTVVVRGLVKSNSEYYRDFAVTVTVTIIDQDPLAGSTTTIPSSTSTTTTSTPPAAAAARRPAALTIAG